MVGGSGELGQVSERGSQDTIERAAGVFLRNYTCRIIMYFVSNFVEIKSMSARCFDGNSLGMCERFKWVCCERCLGI